MLVLVLLAVVLVPVELVPVVEPPVVVLNPVFKLVVAEPVDDEEPVETEPEVEDCIAALTVLGELSVNCPE